MLVKNSKKELPVVSVSCEVVSSTVIVSDRCLLMQRGLGDQQPDDVA